MFRLVKIKTTMGTIGTLLYTFNKAIVAKCITANRAGFDILEILLFLGYILIAYITSIFTSPMLNFLKKSLQSLVKLVLPSKIISKTVILVNEMADIFSIVDFKHNITFHILIQILSKIRIKKHIKGNQYYILFITQHSLQIISNAITQISIFFILTS